VHAVLHLQSNGSNAEAHEALKERLRQACLGGLLAHDHRAQLAVIADEHELPCAAHHRNQALGLGGLRRLVDQHVAEREARQPWVAGTDARRADHLRVAENLALDRTLQRLELLLVARRQLALFVLELLQLLQLALVTRLHVRDAVVQSQELDRRADCFATLGTHTHDAQTALVYLLGQLIDGNVTRRTHEHRR